MWLIVGLGNPGPKYRGTRHNVGFMVLDRLAARASAGPFKEKHKGQLCRASVGGQDVVLLQPLTYMNLSGESVQSAMAFFKTPISEVLVVHDELSRLAPWRFQAGEDQVAQGYTQAWVVEASTPTTHLGTTAALLGRRGRR